MTTAEKRAELAARGEPWPTCECHGVRMLWQQTKYSKGGQWYCQPKVRARAARRRAANKSAGRCVHCASLDLVTATMCGSCRDAHREAVAKHDATPYRQMRKQLISIQRRARARAAEGYAPTEAGQALVLAELSKGSL